MPLLLDIRDDACRFVRLLNWRMSEARAELRLPDLSSEPVIHVLSDYSGDTENPALGSATRGRYRTYSFLFTAGENSLAWYRSEVQKIRQKHHIPADKEIAYKHIHKDDSIYSALPEIVQISRKLNGFLFTLAIENSIRSVFGSQQENVETARAANLRFIKSGPLERALRVSYSIAYWLSVLAREHQRAIWVTDRDEIVASPKIVAETHKILSGALVQTRYAGGKIGNSEVRVLNIVDYEHFPGRDLLAIPDLAAGAVARTLSDIREPDFKVQRGIDTVLDLVTPQAGEPLGSVIFTIDPPHNDGMVRWFARHR